MACHLFSTVSPIFPSHWGILVRKFRKSRYSWLHLFSTLGPYWDGFYISNHIPDHSKRFLMISAFQITPIQPWISYISQSLGILVRKFRKSRYSWLHLFSTLGPYWDGFYISNQIPDHSKRFLKMSAFQISLWRLCISYISQSLGHFSPQVSEK